jgi:hypothetical protein
MWRFALAVDAERAFAGHDDEPIVLQLTKPAAYVVAMRTYFIFCVALGEVYPSVVV